MNRSVRKALVLALPALAVACGGGGSGGGSGGNSGGSAFFVQSCNLGCSSGQGGSQVSCAFANTPQNQEIAVRFSKNVAFGSVTNSSFRVLDVSTGLSAPGTFLLDPTDAARVLFRPRLDFDPQGNPVFGFDSGATYQVLVPGTSQGDAGPFITSTGGASNQSRILCQITTDQGIADVVPGPPNATVLVSLAGGGQTVANGATNVSVNSQVTMIFDDLMNLGTLVTPATGQAPFIRVLVDGDGNLADPSDQTPLQGNFTFTIDQFALRTSVFFSPAAGLPVSGPVNTTMPRKIIVRLPTGITDLSGNQLANAGDIVFETERMDFNPLNVTEGFDDQSLADLPRTGADWGEGIAGRLQPGIGGGSGRLGDLIIRAGQTVTMPTSVQTASGRITFTNEGTSTTGIPAQLDSFVLNGTTFQFNTIPSNPNANPAVITIQGAALSFTLNEALTVIKARAMTDANVAAATYRYEMDPANPAIGHLIITNTVPGTPGNLGGTGDFFFDATPNPMGMSGNPFVVVGELDPVSGMTFLTGGSDGVTFQARDLVTNFDFQANPGATPAPVLIDDGVFEFNRVLIESGGVLRFLGAAPARLFARGDMVIQGLIDVAGRAPLQLGAPPMHPSTSPMGQTGGLGGPNAGRGGDGGDRPDNSNSTGSTGLLGLGAGATDQCGFFHRGISNPGSVITGDNGQGVGTLGTLGSGRFGSQWPINFPPATNTFPPSGLETTPNTNDLANMACGTGSVGPAPCTSAQVGGVGSGGGYATDGAVGVAMAQVPVSAEGGSNTPPVTPGGDSTGILNPTVRLLRPENGHLRGGSGGGGGSANLELTETNGDLMSDPMLCVEGPPAGNDQIIHYRSHSAAAGGGGGGALQIAAGREVSITGVVDASGGDGGTFLNAPALMRFNARSAAPGGGGSGGAVLMQSRSIALPAGVPARLTVLGGDGGAGVRGSLGGDGGFGLLRIENTIGLTALDLDDSIAPPPAQAGGPGSPQILTVGVWDNSTEIPDTFSAATSCWIRPSGSFFALNFDDDQPGDPGWDLTLILDVNGQIRFESYRGPNTVIAMPFQQAWGDLFAEDLMPGEMAAPVVVRFQGAKTTQALTNPCLDDPFAQTSPLAQGSVTPWVRHPSELNAFAPRPDTFRFMVLFDPSSPFFFQGGVQIVGVDEVTVDASPQ